MESNRPLRHLAFFEALGRMDDHDAHWPAVSAGLVVLRLIDTWVDEGPAVIDADAWSIASVREAIGVIDQRSPTARVLHGVIDAMASSHAVDMHVVAPRLMAYAQMLEYDSQWALAADVYTTIVAHAHPSEDGDLVVPAGIQLGACLKNVGDLKGAAEAYASASEIAHANGDMIGVLRARIGEAKLAITRGNMPEAEALLDDTIEQARQHDLTEVQSRALHDRATVATLRHQYDRAVQFGYHALHLATAPRERDRILADIATAFLDLGLIDVARDAYLVLVATAQEEYVRWTAGLNLIDVASRQQMEPMFDHYRRDFENIDLPPFLQASYYLVVGNGYRAFGRHQDAVPYLQRAIEVATEHELNQLLFEAEESLAGARLATQLPASSPVPELSTEVEGVAVAIRGLRRRAAVSG